MPKFVVQEHHATHLHYDFRLEINGVLKSWAVPKGVPLKEKEKRLAIQVEDHALSYGNFHGEIKEGYGKGIVKIWDKGTYKNLSEEDIDKSYKKGKIEIFLKGQKLNGNYALIKFKNQDKNWILLKMSG